MNRRSLSEFRDPILGRLLARRWTIGTLRDISRIPRHNTAGSEFAARFFSAVSRGVSEEAPSTSEAYEAAKVIEAGEFAELPPEQLEQLAEAYLRDNASDMVKRRPDDPAARTDVEPIPGERATDRLLRLAATYLDQQRSAFSKLIETMRGQDISPELKSAFARSAELSSHLGNALAKLDETRVGGLSNIKKSLGIVDVPPGLHMPGPGTPSEHIREHLDPFDPPVFNPDRFLPPPHPGHTTNERLANLAELMGQLIEIGNQQGAFSKAIEGTSRLALQESISSRGDAKWAIRIAVVTLLISIAISAVNIWDNHALSRSSDERMERLITAAGNLEKAMAESDKSADSRAKSELGAMEEMNRTLRKLESSVHPPNASKPATAPGATRGQTGRLAD